MTARSHNASPPSETTLLRDIAWFRQRIDAADTDPDVKAIYRAFIERRLQLLRALRDGRSGEWRSYPGQPPRAPHSGALRQVMLAVIVAVAFTACAPQHAREPSPAHGFETAGIGLGQLVLSPFLIAAGLLEGIVSLPYFIAADLHQLNEDMVRTGALVDVDRTYRYAWKYDLRAVPPDGDTGMAFRHMSDATRHFQQVLAGYGVADHDHYVLTAVRTADPEGFTLYAVVQRPPGPIVVHDARTARTTTLHASDRDYYRPYERDASGRHLDVIIDWAGVPRRDIRTQKGQAILMTIAANSVLTDRRNDGYWLAEERWRTGAFRQIVAEREDYLKQRMGLKS